MSFPYSTNYFVPFHLADPAGIIFFGNVFSITHQVFEQLIVEHFHFSWKDWFQHPDWLAPVRETKAEYFSPLFAGQECLVSLGINSLSTTSFCLTMELKQAKLCSIVTTRHVFCNRTSFTKIPIPSSILPLLQSVMII